MLTVRRSGPAPAQSAAAICSRDWYSGKRATELIGECRTGDNRSWRVPLPQLASCATVGPLGRSNGEDARLSPPDVLLAPPSFVIGVAWRRPLTAAVTGAIVLTMEGEQPKWWQFDETTEVGTDEWQQLQTPEGLDYYFNVRTGETRWDSPYGDTAAGDRWVWLDDPEHVFVAAKVVPSKRAGDNRIALLTRTGDHVSISSQKFSKLRELKVVRHACASARPTA